MANPRIQNFPSLTNEYSIYFDAYFNCFFNTSFSGEHKSAVYGDYHFDLVLLITTIYLKVGDITQTYFMVLVGS